MNEKGLGFLHKRKTQDFPIMPALKEKKKQVYFQVGNQI